MKRIIVTGATGFLGGRTSSLLAAEGLDVVGLGRKVQAQNSGLGFQMVKADLGDLESLNKIFSGADGVIHCAALSSPWGRYEDFYHSNVVGTKNVIEACKKNGVRRLVHVSTPSLYIDKVGRINVRESDPLPARQINYYAETKKMAEDLIDQAASSGLSTITIRPQGIIGPGDTAILPRLMRLAKRGVLPVIGRGDNLIDLTYVDNVAQSLILALKAPANLSGRKYNITNGEPVRLYDALEEIFHKLGYDYKKKHLSFQKAYWIASAMEFSCRTFLRNIEPIMTRYSCCVLGLSRTLNIDAAKRDLGYSPSVSMNQAIERVVQEFRVSEAA